MKITKSELKSMIREALREELALTTESLLQDLTTALCTPGTWGISWVGEDCVCYDNEKEARAAFAKLSVADIPRDCEGIELFYVIDTDGNTETVDVIYADDDDDDDEDEDTSNYRVVLADYDTDDFDINVEFGIQDPDENEVVDYEYLLEPGQTKGDLVVYLSRDCGFTSIYVHDERPASASDIERLSSDTFPVTGTDEYDWQNYGTID
jgi:hypothetical protein